MQGIHRHSARFVLAGSAAVALSMTGVVLLVSDVLFGRVAAAVTEAAAGAGCVLTWCVLPLRRRRALTGRAAGAPGRAGRVPPPPRRSPAAGR